ncbi:MAG: ImmA/IrrE family metallo-endopeptidase [Candidatus Krumholzibacteriia bacterium]
MPYIGKDLILETAEAVAARCHPSLAAPIPVELIIERDFHIEIVVVDGLGATIGCQAYTSWSAREIVVDRRMLSSEPGWYHFSLAHELGHVVLHPQVFQKSGHRTRGEYEAFMARLPEADRERMEKQAQLFAGAFLAPEQTILAVADECVGLAQRAGIELTPCIDVDWPYILKGIADRLQVNERTVAVRFDHLGMLDRYL